LAQLWQTWPGFAKDSRPRELDLVFDCMAHEVASRDLDSFTMLDMALLAHLFVFTLVADVIIIFGIKALS
jgi:hypothetical protein